LLPLPVLLSTAKLSVEATTGDVSYGGMFVVTPTRLALGQLVRVELLLPPNDQLFEAPAKLVYARPAFSTDERPGFGVQFYGLGRDPKTRWEAFIDHVRTTYPESVARWAELARAEPAEGAFPRSEGQVGVLRLHVRGVRDLELMLRRDLQRGAIVATVEGTSTLRPKDEVAVHVFHPLAEHLFELAGRVKRVVLDGPITMLEIELLACDDERRARFADFVEDGQAWIFDEESFTED